MEVEERGGLRVRDMFTAKAALTGDFRSRGAGCDPSSVPCFLKPGTGATFPIFLRARRQYSDS